MKPKTTAIVFFLVMVLVYSQPRRSIAASDVSIQKMNTVTAYSYHAGPGDSQQTARALALYGAKHKAVLLSAERLAGSGLMKAYGDKQREIFCLVVDELQYRIIDESFSENNRTTTIQIESSASLNNFVRAEIRDDELDKQEMHFSLQEEMEPVVPSTIAPAQELSRAYRNIRRHHWRMAIIYLDHLEKKYPYWDALFLAKAMAYLGMHETDKVISALTPACYSGNQEACLKLNELDPSD